VADQRKPIVTDRDIPEVAGQYDRFPYPERRPEDERGRLISTWLDDLRMINHHCFRGEQTFDKNFRVLVAGGGTGDGTIFLAEQLRPLGGHVVHLDFSTAALSVARERARIRGLRNIEWVEASLLALPQLGLGTFDLINCVGVLHHLREPEQGLDALLEVLAPEGAMALLVYARYGRTGVYQMQELLRRINRDESDATVRLARARATLAALPRSNWFLRGEDLHRDHVEGGDAGLYDLLLHPQDRAYTVPELYEWLTDRQGLTIEFSDWHRGMLPYLVEHYFEPRQPELLSLVRTYPAREQHAIAELIGGDIATHSLFATRVSKSKATYGDLDFVPVFVNEKATGEDFVQLIERHNDLPFVLQHAQSRLQRRLDPGRFVKEIFRHMDGTRTFREIFNLVQQPPLSPVPTEAQFWEEFRPWYAALETIERLVLRRPGAYQGLQGFSLR